MWKITLGSVVNVQWGEFVLHILMKRSSGEVPMKYLLAVDIEKLSVTFFPSQRFSLFLLIKVLMIPVYAYSFL